MRSWSEMGPAMPTASPRKAWRLLSCSCSFTNGCADPSPTAASIISPTPHIGPIAGSRRPTTVLMQRSRKSSICLPPLDGRLLTVALVQSNILRDRTYAHVKRSFLRHRDADAIYLLGT